MLFLIILKCKYIGHTLRKNLVCLNLFIIMPVKNNILKIPLVSILISFQHQFQEMLFFDYSRFLEITVQYKRIV